MNEITFELQGTIASKKNSKQLVYSGNRPYFVPSKAYKLWEDDAVIQIKSQLADKSLETPITQTCKLSLHIYRSTKIRHDLDNGLSSIQDMLVKAKVLPDDWWGYIDEVYMIRYQSDEDKCLISLLPKEYSPKLPKK